MDIIRFPLEDLLGDGIIRESDFRASLAKLDLTPYRDQPVMVPWIHKQEIPIWVYLMAVAKLAPVVAVLSFGEPCSPIALVQNKRVGSANFEDS
ncbi:MAG: DUF2480 family protein [Calditrichaeota bacterium]|nr:DUF2480 family protein [Calditrichota bacterium]MCB9391407.1 DUF2480 family protein [Calditrichota bacterium]